MIKITHIAPACQANNLSEHFYNRYTASQLRILNYLLYLFNKYKQVMPSQKDIAKHLGMDPKTVYTALVRFERDGLLRKTNRGVKQTCLYVLNKKFNQPNVRWKLAVLLPALRKLAISFLLSTASKVSCQLEYSRQSITSYLNNNTVTKNLVLKETKYNKESRVMSDNSRYRPKTEVIGSEPITLQGVFPVSVHNLKNIDLTDAGKIKLSAFPDEIIKIADGFLGKKGPCRDPWGYLCKVALGESKKRGLTPNFKKANSLFWYFKLSENSPMFVPRPGQVSNDIPLPVKKTAGADKAGSPYGSASQDRQLVEKTLPRDISPMTEREKKSREEKNIDYYQSEIAKCKARLEALDPKSEYTHEAKNFMLNTIAYCEEQIQNLMKQGTLEKRITEKQNV